MDAQDSPNEVTLFLDGGDLYLTGRADAVDGVLDTLLGPEQARHRRSATGLAGGVAAASTVAAFGAASEELFRLTPDAAAKLAAHGAQLTEGGAIRGFVRNNGQFAGDVAFQPVSLGAEQALAMQTAAISLALRSAIADVQAAVEAVDEKVTEIQRRVRAREVGEVIGTLRHLQQIVDATRTRGQLLTADWDQAASARRDLEIALEGLRAYVTESINDIDASESLPRRESAIERFASPKGAAGSLQLILVAEQALYLFEYLRLERIRATDPEHLQSALAEARDVLAGQRERDAALIRTASARIADAKRVEPLEIHRVFSIPHLREAASRAGEALDSFAASSQSEVPAFDRSVVRPQLSETRAEVLRHAIAAKDGVADVSKTIGPAISRGARHTSRSVRERVRR